VRGTAGGRGALSRPSNLQFWEGKGGVSGECRGGKMWRGGGADSDARSGFRRKKTTGLADRVGPPVIEGEATRQAGPEGDGREVGCGWAGKEGRRPSEVARARRKKKRKEAMPKSLLGLKSKRLKENQF
jgi:hypothetical protein